MASLSQILYGVLITAVAASAGSRLAETIYPQQTPPPEDISAQRVQEYQRKSYNLVGAAFVGTPIAAAYVLLKRPVRD